MNDDTRAIDQWLDNGELMAALAEGSRNVETFAARLKEFAQYRVRTYWGGMWPVSARPERIDWGALAAAHWTGRS